MITTTAPTPIIEHFLPNFGKNIIECAFYFEEEEQGRQEEISMDYFSEWLCKNHFNVVQDYRYYDTEYSSNMINRFDMINNIETFRKDIQNEFLNYYLNTFKK